METIQLGTKRIIKDLVSIVIPHAGLLELLKKCIENVRRYTIVEYEIIIAADRCDDETLEYLKSLYKEGVRLILNPELMSSPVAENMGYMAAQGEYLCTLSNDVGVVPGWLRAMKETLSQHPEYGWVALADKQEPPNFSAGASLFTHETLQKLGLMDEIFADGCGFDDDDYLRRMLKAGYDPHIVPQPRVDHPHLSPTLPALYGEEQRMPRFYRNQRLFQEKWGESGTIWENLPVAEPVKLPEVRKEKAGVKVPTSQPPEGIPECWRNFATGRVPSSERRTAMLRVALIAPSCFAINGDLAYGGAEVCVLNLCEELKAYCDVTLIAPKGSYLDGVRVMETVEPRSAWVQEEVAYELYKSQLSQFDIVHSNEHQMLAYRYKIEHPEIKMCHTLHGIQTLSTLHPVPKPNLIVLSRFHEKECQGRYGGEYAIIPHGIDLNKYKFTPDKEDYFLHFGLITPHKGPDITLDLVKRAGVKVTIAGEDRFVADHTYVEKVKDACQELGINYLGTVSLDQKISLIQRAKAVLLPFRIDEVYSLIAIESLSCGTPVICSNVGAMAEIVTHGVDGFLCNSLDDFVMAVNSASNISPLNCRIKAEKEFSRSLMAQRHFALYQEIVGGKKESAPPSEIEQFMKEKAGVKVPTSQPPEGIPECWRQFAAGDRMRGS